jgi:uncharacterized membrane protein
MVEPGIEPGTSWLVIRSSDHQTTRLVRFKINKGYVTILRLHVPEDGRNEEADRFYQQLQEITDKINKNNYFP